MGFMRKPLLYAHMQAQVKYTQDFLNRFNTDLLRIIQDHLNDTIVVNQPRLTTEENQELMANQVITLPAGANELLMEETDNGQVKFIFALYTI